MLKHAYQCFSVVPVHLKVLQERYPKSFERQRTSCKDLLTSSKGQPGLQKTLYPTQERVHISSPRCRSLGLWELSCPSRDLKRYKRSGWGFADAVGLVLLVLVLCVSSELELQQPYLWSTLSQCQDVQDGCSHWSMPKGSSNPSYQGLLLCECHILCSKWSLRHQWHASLVMCRAWLGLKAQAWAQASIHRKPSPGSRLRLGSGSAWA